MSQLKTRLQALTLLDRALAAISDDDLAAMVAALPDEHRTSLDGLCGARDGVFTDPAARLLAVRAHAARGRMNGGLEQIAALLVDACLARCIDDLGDNADNPTEEQLLTIVPGLVGDFGLPTVRLMLAASVAGEAAAAPMLTRLLKHDATLSLPPVEPAATVVLPARRADDEARERRRALKERKQADARARREQQARARGR